MSEPAPILSNPRSVTSTEVFLTSPWIPAEWVRAHALVPRALLFAPGFNNPVAMPGAGVCAFAQQALQFAEAFPGSAAVFSTHCDQLRRAGDLLGPGGPHPHVFLFNLPVTARRSVVERMFRAELERVGKFLLRIGGRASDPEAVACEAQAHENARIRWREAAEACGGREYARALARFHWEGPRTPPPLMTSGQSSSAQGPRVALLGGPLSPEHGLWDQLQALGAQVVLNGTEWGERSLGNPAPQADLAPRPASLELLARRFFTRCVDVFQRPNQRLYDWLAPRLSRRRVQGIIVWHHFGCDLWRAEAQSLREKFGLPLLLLEADESGSAARRDANRIQAFVEAMT